MLNRKMIFLCSLLVTVVGFSLVSLAGEHKGKKISGSEEAKVKKAAQTYISAQVQEKGSFEIDDAVTNKKRKLKFDYFHTINKLDNGDYFFCADFTEGKDRLDLDFTMDRSNLTVQKIVIHKVNGVAR